VTYNNALYVATQASTDKTPGSSGSGSYWGTVSLGSGSSPTGIPYTFVGHVIGTAVTPYFGNLLGTTATSGSVPASYAVLIPNNCTATLTIWHYGNAEATYSLYTVTPTNGGSTWTAGSSLASVSLAAASGPTPTSNTSSPIVVSVTAGELLTLGVNNTASPGTAFSTGFGYFSAFSCE
jgi:hypothetical protein